MKLKQIRVDGYKNLVNCEVNLGDFNVLVGPNNSGKSNLLEAVQILWPLCFSDEKLRKQIFEGLTPRLTADSSICHLKKRISLLKFSFFSLQIFINKNNLYCLIS